jgi:PleD family two-component response regulator
MKGRCSADVLQEFSKKESEIRRKMSKGKILVVDDDRNLLELVKMRLESADYEVTTTLREEDAFDIEYGK